MYRIVLEWDKEAYRRVFIADTYDSIFARDLFNFLARRQTDYFETYGPTKHEWFLSMYDVNPDDEFEIETFSVGGNKSPYMKIPQSVRTNALRRKFLSQRELEGLDD